MHNLIVGQTRSGKTTLAKRICQALNNKGFGCLVLDTLNDQWVCGYQTTEVIDFIKTAKSSRNCFLFIDESWENVSHHDTDNLWLATQSRHWGHTAFFISQRLQLLSVTARNQCSNLYLFNSNPSDCKILSDEFNDPLLIEANQLNRGEYICKSRFAPAIKYKLF